MAACWLQEEDDGSWEGGRGQVARGQAGGPRTPSLAPECYAPTPLPHPPESQLPPEGRVLAKALGLQLLGSQNGCHRSSRSVCVSADGFGVMCGGRESEQTLREKRRLEMFCGW